MAEKERGQGQGFHARHTAHPLPYDQQQESPQGSGHRRQGGIHWRNEHRHALFQRHPRRSLARHPHPHRRPCRGGDPDLVPGGLGILRQGICQRLQILSTHRQMRQCHSPDRDFRPDGRMERDHAGNDEDDYPGQGICLHRIPLPDSYRTCPDGLEECSPLRSRRAAHSPDPG